MRTVSQAALQSLFAQHTENVWIPAVTISHPDLPSVHYFVANTKDIVYNSKTYLACPFQFDFAADTEASVTQARLRIDNVSQDIITAVRSTDTSPTVVFELFRVDGLGTVTRETNPLTFSLLAVNADALIVEGTLGYEMDFLNEPAVNDRFVPSIAPGMF